MDRTLVTGSVPPKMRTSAGDVFSLLSRARRQALPATGPMTVVAFSDPNDLLSYRIIPDHLAEDLKEFRVINVLVSNDATYFGYLERPDMAHCGYPWNPRVFGMLARGYQAGKPLPSVSGMSSGTCPDYIWTEGSRVRKVILRLAEAISRCRRGCRNRAATDAPEGACVPPRASRGKPCACGRARGCR